jgi:hypothetical protein
MLRLSSLRLLLTRGHRRLKIRDVQLPGAKGLGCLIDTRILSSLMRLVMVTDRCGLHRLTKSRGLLGSSWAQYQ